MENKNSYGIASWPKDFAVLDMPWGKETINTTWPYIAVSVPEKMMDGTTDPAMMYHTDSLADCKWCDFILEKQTDGKYKTIQRKESL
jgi:hypothetical protein